MRRTFIIAVFSMAFILLYGDVFAKIVVKSVKGEVAYKKGRHWAPLKKGQNLIEGTKISTGIRSSALIGIDRHNLKINQLTMMKIFRNRTTRKRRDTHIGLKYGSLNARVKRIKRLKTSFKITTPVATSSVRGTEEYVSYGPKSGMIIRVKEGSVWGETRGVKNIIKGRAKFQIKPDNPRPDNLLSELRNRSLLRIHSDDITDAESNSHEYWGDDFFDNSEGPVEFVNYKKGFYERSSAIYISLEWPDGYGY